MKKLGLLKKFWFVPLTSFISLLTISTTSSSEIQEEKIVKVIITKVGEWNVQESSNFEVPFIFPLKNHHIDLKAMAANGISVDELSQSEEASSSSPSLSPRAFISGMATFFNTFILIGDKLWNLVLKGKPTIRSEHIPVSVLPRFPERLTDPMELENWQLPKVVAYNYVALTNFGNEAVNFTYAAQFSYGGDYEGKGQYLTGVTIVPLEVHVRWNYAFDAKTYVDAITNLKTKENPLAAVTLRLNFSHSSLTTNTLVNKSYTIVGNGDVIPLE